MDRLHQIERSRAPHNRAPAPAARAAEWMTEAMQHLFAEVTAQKRR